MIVQPENPAFAVAPAVGLETFEARARIMKNMSRRVQLQRRQRLDRRRAPGAINISCDRDTIAKFSAERLHCCCNSGTSNGTTLPPMGSNWPAGKLLICA
jgi:hypothetical protein